jgi:hypothetical protein
MYVCMCSGLITLRERVQVGGKLNISNLIDDAINQSIVSSSVHDDKLAPLHSYLPQ